ncbi:MAG: CPBP family intramembrane metalloprotease [Dehalococcoidia bacterium]|nr:CPBP family intramembrane metalloprotease [Dehalococcoidia bacterium]
MESAALAIALLGYSNGVTPALDRRAHDGRSLARWTNRAAIGALLLWAARRPGGVQAIGLTRERIARNVIVGLGVGSALAIAPIVFFRNPIVLDGQLEYADAAGHSTTALIWELGVRLPIEVAFLEELAFRGLLTDSLERWLTPPTALVAQAAIFGAWHIAITTATVRRTNLRDATLPGPLRRFATPIAVVGGLLATAVGGGVFGLTRRQSGSLVAPVLAHWAVDALMTVALWRGGAPRRSTTLDDAPD